VSHLRRQSGQATIEFGGMMIYVLLAALFVWQMALVGWTALSATSAARTASRMASRGAPEATAIKDGYSSLSGHFLNTNSHVSMSGADATVSVRIPLLFPGLSTPLPPVIEHADLPATG
jgi:Flp pilus assembly protein TadG